MADDVRPRSAVDCGSGGRDDPSAAYPQQAGPETDVDAVESSLLSSGAMTAPPPGSTSGRLSTKWTSDPSSSSSSSAFASPPPPPPPPTRPGLATLSTYRHSVQSHITSLLSSLGARATGGSMHTDLSLLAERNREHGRAWVQEGYARYMSGVPADFRLDDGGRGADSLADKMMQARGAKRQRRLTDDGAGEGPRSRPRLDVNLQMTEQQPSIIREEDHQQAVTTESSNDLAVTGTPRSQRSYSTSAVKDRRRIFREIAEAAHRAQQQQEQSSSSSAIPNANSSSGRSFTLQQPPPPKNVAATTPRKLDSALTGSGASGAITSDSITSLTSASLSCHTTGMTPMTPWQHNSMQPLPAIHAPSQTPAVVAAASSSSANAAADAANAAMWADFVDLDAAGTPTTGKSIPTHRLFPP